MSNKPIDKPSWLTALNGKKEQPLAPTDEVLQEPAVLEVGEDESVAALPKYDTPPDLDLGPKQAIGRGTRVPEPVVIKNITEPTSSTKLPFPFDAEAFGRHVYIPEFVGNDGVTTFPKQDRMPDAILDDGSMIEFKTSRCEPKFGQAFEGFPASTGTINNGEFLPNNIDELPNVVSGQRAIKPEDVIESGINITSNPKGGNWLNSSHMDPDYRYAPDLDKQVTQTGQQILGELIEKLPDCVLYYDDKEMNPLLDPVCKTCGGAGMVRRSIRHDESDVEEWDDDCPDCVGAEELPAGTMAGLFKDPKGLEPGTYTTQLNDKLELVNVMPFMPNEEALLPEPKIGLEDREVLSSESWLGLMTPTESIAYDNHTTLVMQSNPLHAAHLIRLKGFRSKYFQEIITTPERAEEHIRVAIVKGEDPGGWDNSDHRRVKQAQQLIAKGFEVKAKQEARQRHRLYIQQTRDAWKQAVEYRKSALEILDTDVANKKETFQLARDMTFNEYMARFEPGD